MSGNENETELSRHYTTGGLIRFSVIPILTITTISKKRWMFRARYR